jgi:hypothetical protein
MSNPLVEKLFALIPMLLIGMVIFGNVMFAAAVIFPAWRAHEEAASQVTTAQETLVSQAASQDEAVRIALLEKQIETAQTTFDETTGQFLTAEQGDTLLRQLYQYAQDSQVEINSLRTQPAIEPESETQLYEVRLYRLQINGEIASLIRFLVRLREAAAPVVVLDKLSIGKNQGTDSLMIDVAVYVSPLADGTALSNLPEAPVMAEVPVTAEAPLATSDASVIPVTETAIATDAALAVLPVTPEMVVTSVGDNTLPAADTSCAGAPETRFVIGDTVVVDFNQNGALRILARVDAPDPYVETRAQAYDDQRLQILAGPVCGTWNGRNIWYWFVQREGFGNFQGWAAEASQDDRWMCPLDNPECAQ